MGINYLEQGLAQVIMHVIPASPVKYLLVLVHYSIDSIVFFYDFFDIEP